MIIHYHIQTKKDNKWHIAYRFTGENHFTFIIEDSDSFDIIEDYITLADIKGSPILIPLRPDGIKS